VLVGLSQADDAGVYRVSDELALVQTVDFFTPIVDEPELFGRIAAVNALSDVYAMGGVPLCALNIVCFPRDEQPMSVLRDILRGAGDACTEAGVAVVGGHSVVDKELKFGLAVTGRIHPQRILRKAGGRVGDRLILTKALGTGAVTTGLKRGRGDSPAVTAAIASMSTLNRAAAEVLVAHGARAMTDITGFGLIGHAAEMVEGQDVGFALDAPAVPLLPGALDCAAAGVLPGGLTRNRRFREPMVDVAAGVEPHRLTLLYDPQTSGGLLAALPPEQAPLALAALHAAGVGVAAIVGEVVAAPAGRIAVR
jgi:selenide,water dikinase